jgi:hypothetical protein
MTLRILLALEKPVSTDPIGMAVQHGPDIWRQSGHGNTILHSGMLDLIILIPEHLLSLNNTVYLLMHISLGAGPYDSDYLHFDLIPRRAQTETPRQS